MEKIDFTIVPKIFFGEMIQALYDSEHSFKLEFIWDSGYNWTFSSIPNEVPDSSTLSLMDEIRKKGIDYLRDIEMTGGLILYDYQMKYSLTASNGELNKMGEFIDSLKNLSK